MTANVYYFAAVVVETVLEVIVILLATYAFTNTVLGAIATLFVVSVYLNLYLLICLMLRI